MQTARVGHLCVPLTIIMLVMYIKNDDVKFNLHSLSMSLERHFYFC